MKIPGDVRSSSSSTINSAISTASFWTSISIGSYVLFGERDTTMYSNLERALKSRQFHSFLHLLERTQIETLLHSLDSIETELPAGRLGADQPTSSWTVLGREVLERTDIGRLWEGSSDDYEWISVNDEQRWMSNTRLRFSIHLPQSVDYK